MEIYYIYHGFNSSSKINMVLMLNHYGPFQPVMSDNWYQKDGDLLRCCDSVLIIYKQAILIKSMYSICNQRFFFLFERKIRNSYWLSIVLILYISYHQCLYDILVNMFVLGGYCSIWWWQIYCIWDIFFSSSSPIYGGYFY